MKHPSQLDIFAKPNPQGRQQFNIELPRPQIADFRYWRDGDLLDMVEMTCNLVKSEEMKANPQHLLEIANELQLPSSLTTLLLNTIGRIQNLFQLSTDEERFGLEVREIPNTAELAKHLGLGGVFTKEVGAIWKAPQANNAIEAPMDREEPSVPQQAPQPVLGASTEMPSVCTITTNRTATGRQWKIAGQLIAEVEHTQLGHIGKMYSGQFCNPTRPYREYEPAANQCRQHTEGILKFLKTIPR